MKKYGLLLVLILTFFCLNRTVFAAYGEINYRITSINIRNEKLTFNGWAFIGTTNNTSNNQHQIKISAYRKKDKKLLETKTASGSDSGGHNFYSEFCFKYTHTDGKYRCDYTNETSKDKELKCDADEDTAYSEGRYGDMDCHYRDMDFSIQFDISKWDIEGETEVYFEISAYNTWYGKWTTPVRLAVDKTVADKLPNRGMIKKATLSSYGKFIPFQGMLRESYDNPKWISCTVGNCSRAIGVRNETYEISNFRDDVTVDSNGIVISSGFYAIKTENEQKGDGEYYPCTSDNCTTQHIAPASWLIPNGDFILIINNSKCDVDNHKDKAALDCNSAVTINSICNKLSVYGNSGDTSASAIVRIDETGYVSNLLTPTSLYNGGGFKFAFVYRNTIKWSYVSKSWTGNDNTRENIINSEMTNKVKTLANFTSGVKLSNVKFNNGVIDGSLFNVQCTESGSFTNDNTLVTTCVMSLPDSTLKDYTGDVVYSHSGIANVINKYYVPLNFWGSYKIRATFGGLDRLTENSATGDSKERGKSWTGDWSMPLSNNNTCNINVYPLFSDQGGYKFVYRPITVNNPFPDRNPGFNWYDWWKGSNSGYNQNRMKTTYDDDKLEYYSKLSKVTISEIMKKYGSKNYLSWEGIDDKEKSSFVDNFVVRVGDK